MTRNTNKFASGSPASLIVILGAVLIVVIGGVIFFATTTGNNSNESDSAMETSTSSPTTTTEDKLPDKPWRTEETSSLLFTSPSGASNSVSVEGDDYIKVTLGSGEDKNDPIQNLFVVEFNDDTTRVESVTPFSDLFEYKEPFPSDPTSSDWYALKDGKSVGTIHFLTFKDPGMSKVCQENSSSQKCLDTINDNTDVSNIVVTP